MNNNSSSSNNNNNNKAKNIIHKLTREIKLIVQDKNNKIFGYIYDII